MEEEEEEEEEEEDGAREFRVSFWLLSSHLLFFPIRA